MSPTLLKPRVKVKPASERPPLWKVILLNDDFTPREFVVQVLKAVFRMNADQALPCDDDGAPEGRLRDRGLYARRGGDQGQGGDRAGACQRLSVVFHDGEGVRSWIVADVDLPFVRQASDAAGWKVDI